MSKKGPWDDVHQDRHLPQNTRALIVFTSFGIVPDKLLFAKSTNNELYQTEQSEQVQSKQIGAVEVLHKRSQPTYHRFPSSEGTCPVNRLSSAGAKV